MKKTLLQAALLLSMLGVSSQQSDAAGFSFLTVTLNGEQVNFDIKEIKKITFDAENMYLSMKSETGSGETGGSGESGGKEEVTALPFTMLTNMTISDPTGIISVAEQDKGKVELKGNTLNVDMLSEGTVVIYDASGKAVQSVNVKGGKNAIDLGQMQKGVYIIKVNGSTQKIMNQ